MKKGFRQKPQGSVGTVLPRQSLTSLPGKVVTTTGVSQSETEGGKREPADAPRALGTATSAQRPSSKWRLRVSERETPHQEGHRGLHRLP